MAINIHPNKYDAKRVVMNRFVNDGFDFTCNVSELSVSEKAEFARYAKGFKYRGSKRSLIGLGAQFFMHLQKIHKLYITTKT